MMPIMQINLLLYKTEAGKNRVGVSGREGGREREKQIKKERDGA
jgi:hypothetical protein